MESVAPLDEQFYIVAEADRPRASLRVLKHGDSFAVFDRNGDISSTDAAESGIYHDGTRFLSVFELLLAHSQPLLLSSTISDDNALFTADLTNPDLLRDGRVVIPRGEVHLFRSRVLCAGSCLERVRVTNFARHPISLLLTITFDSDFADVFEVRGTRRARRGSRLPDVARANEYVLGYRGLDNVERRTRIRFSEPSRDLTIEPGHARVPIRLDPLANTEFELSVTYEMREETKPVIPHGDALTTVRRSLAQRVETGCTIVSSNESFNRWLRRSTADLEMMLTDTPYGRYPYAGIPWFSTPFGRDGLITGLELLWMDPDIARGVLAFLAATQATRTSDEQDAQPGKILHEMRGGEMPALGEVPFGRYYGTADATPLFVMLAHRYFERTGDRELIDRLWPNIVAALGWMQKYGDLDGDGFIEYARRSDSGLVQQGWKDSYDSVFHADGELAQPPIALCEVQGYAYAAWSGAAQLATMVRNDEGQATEWAAVAEQLRVKFEEAFWCEDIGTYALALDGRKHPCRVRTSNPGHCLFSGIASRERARQVSSTLMDDRSFAGWGVRTVAAGEARYNPMAYHNGSIWPHDNALMAAGASRYGSIDAAQRILGGMFDLSLAVDLHRLPELICGFHRRGEEHPTLYPVACAPQAWASGAVFLLLEACLGLQIDAQARRVSFRRAALPQNVEWLKLSNLRVADASVDLLLQHHPYDVGVTVLRREGNVEIVTVT